MRTANDLMLVMDNDPDSVRDLRGVAETLGCDRVEVDSVESLREILAIRLPTVAMLAVDRSESSGLEIFQALADHHARPALFLLGSINARVFAGLRRAAESRGLTMVATLERPLDRLEVSRLLAMYLNAPPPVARGELEQAFEAQELILHYQPKMALGTEDPRVLGVEALVRWQHPRLGMLHPRHFLPAIEEYDLHRKLTDFVMTEAVRQAGDWHARGLTLEMAINLSPRLVQDRDFAERVARLLREHGLPPQHLVLDVTEASSAMDRDLMLDVFTRLRMLGVGLSLDNFGTGSSSLTEVYRMPYSEIKVDHSLIADAVRDRDASVIVRAISELARTLGLNVCAEGVETRQMLKFVRDCGFNSAQGRFFSDAVRSSDIEKFVRSWSLGGPGATGCWPAQPLSVASSRTAHGLCTTSDLSRRNVT